MPKLRTLLIFVTVTMCHGELSAQYGNVQALSKEIWDGVSHITNLACDTSTGPGFRGPLLCEKQFLSAAKAWGCPADHDLLALRSIRSRVGVSDSSTIAKLNLLQDIVERADLAHALVNLVENPTWSNLLKHAGIASSIALIFANIRHHINDSVQSVNDRPQTSMDDVAQASSEHELIDIVSRLPIHDLECIRDGLYSALRIMYGAPKLGEQPRNPKNSLRK